MQSITRSLQKYNYADYSLFILGFSMPLSISMLTKGIAVALFLLVAAMLKQKRQGGNGIIPVVPMLMVSLFIVCLISILLNPPYRFGSIEIQLSLVAIPVLLYLTAPLIDVSVAMAGFVLGNILTGIINLLRATYFSIKITDGQLVFDSTVWGGISVWESIDHVGNYFFSQHFTGYIHPSYWSMYLTIAILFVWFRNPTKSRLHVRITLITFFSILIFLCASRAGVLVFVAVLIFLMFTHLKFVKNRKLKFAIVSSIAVASFLFFYSPRMLILFEMAKRFDFHENSRVQLWKGAFSLIDAKSVFGVGPQHVKERLTHYSVSNGLEQLAEFQLNVHNQYLESLLGTGIAGLVVLLLILGYSLKQSLKNIDHLLLLTTLSLGAHLLFESMLSRIHGVVFFAFFITILVIKNSVRESRT